MICYFVSCMAINKVLHDKVLRSMLHATGAGGRVLVTKRIGVPALPRVLKERPRRRPPSAGSVLIADFLFRQRHGLLM